MKLPQIILLIAIAFGIGIIVSVSLDVSTYRTFKEAQEMAEKNDKSEVHVVGSLLKNAKGEIQGMFYKPTIDPNYFTFPLKDSLGTTMTVVSTNPKPADFDVSEKVVVIGKVNGDKFMASKILLKCPSKYNEAEEKKQSYIIKSENIAATN
jgi:cytochrome c-type biogenesis protein CcmE